MITHRTLPALTLPLLLMTAPALANPECSGGSYAANALIVPPPDTGTIAVATQHAWDGGGRLHDVCNLLTEGDSFYATWMVFSGEVDSNYPGICVSVTTAEGTEWYSCQPPSTVSSAFAETPGTEQATLRFETWQPRAPALR